MLEIEPISRGEPDNLDSLSYITLPNTRAADQPIPREGSDRGQNGDQQRNIPARPVIPVTPAVPVTPTVQAVPPELVVAPAALTVGIKIPIEVPIAPGSTGRVSPQVLIQEIETPGVV